MGRLDGRLHLRTCHLGPFRRPGHGVPAGDEHLDDPGPLLDLLANRLSELVGAVTQVQGARLPELPIPGGGVVGMTRRAHITTARDEAGATNGPLLDGPNHRGVNSERRPGAHGRREPRQQDLFEVVHGPHGLERGGSSSPKGPGTAPSSW